MEDQTFNKKMLQGINTDCYYPIKRSFGQTLQNCSIDALLAYIKLSDISNKNKYEQNIEFLIAGLCYNINKIGKERTEYINFEKVLKRLDRPTEIENFLKLRYDNDGYFAKRFYILAKKAIPLLKPNEQINYTQLYKDFKYWNFNNSTQMRWAMTITNFNDENNENDEKKGNL